MRKLDKTTLTYKLKLIFIPLLAFEILFWTVGFWFISNLGFFQSYTAGEKLLFRAENYAYLFALLPLLYIFLFVHLRRVNKLRNQIGLRGNRQFKPLSTTYTLLKIFFFRNMLVFCVFSLMQPSFGSRKVSAQVKDIEVVFAVDISNSMNTEDMSGKTSRLDAAKKAINQYINKSQSRKVGMVIFAGSAYPQLPLTADIGAAKMYTEELNTHLISNQGTNLALAIELGLDYFDEDKKSKKVIVLITDGENHEGGIDKVIPLLKEKNVDLQILGLGSNNGGLIPVQGSRSRIYLKDQYGKSVISRIDKGMIKDLANKANAKIVISDDEFPNINTLLAEFNSKEPTKSVELKLEIKENHYQVFLIFAVLMLLGYLTSLELEKIQQRRK